MTQQPIDTRLDMVVAALQGIKDAIDDLSVHLVTALSQSGSD